MLVLQRSPNGWSCVPTSFAMVLDLPVGRVIELLGHDGSEIVWPDQEEPYCRRAFHIQELVYLTWNLGYTATEFEAIPVSQGRPGVEPLALAMYVPVEVRMPLVMRGQPGVLTGETPRGMRHAVAWDGFDCYDPNGTTYGLEKFILQSFWAIKSVK